VNLSSSSTFVPHLFQTSILGGKWCLYCHPNQSIKIPKKTTTMLPFANTMKSVTYKTIKHCHYLIFAVVYFMDWEAWRTNTAPLLLTNFIVDELRVADDTWRLTTESSNYTLHRRTKNIEQTSPMMSLQLNWCSLNFQLLTANSCNNGKLIITACTVVQAVV